jgi:hypothetical protein
MKPSKCDEGSTTSSVTDSESNASTPNYSDASSPHSTSTPSSCASNEETPKEYVSEPPPFAPGALDLASGFYLLLKLHNLTLIPWLPFMMKSWIQDRISWIENHSDPYSAARLKDMIKKRPADGFPVIDAPDQILYGTICETIATTAADQRLWFLAHAWLFVGLDWNTGSNTEADTSFKESMSDTWQGN